MRAAFYTLGCKLNQFETEALASAFRGRGFFIVPWTEEAEIYIVNTCTVTTKSEQKGRRAVRQIIRTRPGAKVVITGCYAQVEEEFLRREFPGTIVVPQDKKAMLLNTDLHNFLQDSSGLESPDDDASDLFSYAPGRVEYHSRASLKIQDGCSNRCAYCRIPLARGNSVSIDPKTAVRRVKEFEEAGYSEVIITGVNISAFRFEETTLPMLLDRFLKETAAIRFRLSSLEPDMVTEELLQVAVDKRVRPHFHIPVQSGSDRVLMLMKRKYTVDTVIETVKRFRTIKKDPFIAADFIVGFPGEGDTEFRETASLVKELDFAGLHVFQFSPRPGTAAEKMNPKVPERIAKERSEQLVTLGDAGKERYKKRWEGKTVEATVIGCNAEEISVITENYLQGVGKIEEERDLRQLPAGVSCRVLLGPGREISFVF